MHRRHRANWALGLGTLLLLAATGCSADGTGASPDRSDATPSGAAATTPAPSPTASPTPDPSVAPAGETAEQFIRRWIELGNRMQATGETEAYLAVAGPDCATCRTFADNMARIYGAGGSVQGGDERVISLKPESPEQWVIDGEATPSRYTERAGGPIKTFKGGRYRTRVYLVQVDGRWTVGLTERLPL